MIIHFKRTRQIGLAFALAAAMLVWQAARASAQALADRVPDDALQYIGWSGADHLGPAFAESHFKAFLDQSNLPKTLAQVFPQLAEKITDENPDAAEPLQVLSTIGPIVWTHPAAYYFGGLDPVKQLPKVALLVDAGNDAAALLGQIQALLNKAPPEARGRLEATNYNGLVAITIGRTPEFDALLGGPSGAQAAKPLSQRKEFQDDLSGMVKSPVLTEYIDVTTFVNLIDGLTAMAPAQAQERWATFRDLLGLKDVRSAAMTCGFEDKDWAAQILATPAAGAVFSPQPPLGDDLLKMIPADATVAGAKEFDLAKMFDRVHDSVAASNPQAADRMEEGLHHLNEILGLDFRKDLLGPLGSEWVGYSSPSVGGNSVLGMVMINHLSDAAKAEQSLTQLESVIDHHLARMFGKRSHIGFEQTSFGGATIHYLSVPVVSPCWAVKDGNLYVALYPQVIESALRQSSAGTSILDNSDFAALRKKLGGEKASAIAFYDLPKIAPNTYPILLMLTQALKGAGNIYGIQTPATVLPRIDELEKDIEPSGAVIFTDSTGWHLKAVCSFPGSDLLAIGNDAMLVAGAAILAHSHR